MTWYGTTLQVPFNQWGVPASRCRVDFGAVQADQGTRWFSKLRQPWCEWIALLSGSPGLKQNEMALCSCHRDIGETFRFSSTFQFIAVARRMPQSPMRIERYAPAAGAVRWGHTPQRTFARRGRFPQIGADHHWILQTFAAMHSDNSNCTLGKITEGLALFWVRVGRVKALASQPIGTTGGIQALAVHRVLHESCTLLKVTE